MNRIVIDRELCKGCGLCMEFCPAHIIHPGTQANQSGYLCPVQEESSACTACCLCAWMCPDSAIEVYKNVECEGQEVR